VGERRDPGLASATGLAGPRRRLHEQRGETWLLMEDVSEGILPPGSFDPQKLDRLLGGVARLHARYWGKQAELEKLPLLELSAVARLFGEPALEPSPREDGAAQTLSEARRRAERRYLEDLLRAHDGKAAAAARAAGVARVYFYRLLSKHGLKPGGDEG